jgi:hypothetical protein
MHVETAQLPGPNESDDRVFVTDNAVIVLDGASAFRPVPVPAATYAETLGGAMAERLTSTPAADLVTVLAGAIEATTESLSLTPGDSPSSTVAVARLNREGSWDLLVLGDSQIATPHAVLRDDRQAAVATQERDAYCSRLAAGHGYDEEHRRLIQELQHQQARRRNQPNGFWIAEANPQAARHALTATVSGPWTVLATDGAYRPMNQLARSDWTRISEQSSEALAAVLQRCHEWEQTDPDGQLVPRAKRHDDKTLASTRCTSPTSRPNG